MKAAVNMFVVFVMIIKVILEVNKNKFNTVHMVIVLDYVNYPVVVSNYRSNMSKEICVMSNEMIGSYAGVIDLQKDIIMLSTCLIQLLSNEELEAVIAHELGHRFHRNRHISHYNREEYELITEYEADQYACCTGHGRPLISALEKIVSSMFGMNSIYEEVSDPHISHLLSNTVKPRIRRIKRYLDI